jgi:hypothetical protein
MASRQIVPVGALIGGKASLAQSAIEIMDLNSFDHKENPEDENDLRVSNLARDSSNK